MPHLSTPRKHARSNAHSTSLMTKSAQTTSVGVDDILEVEQQAIASQKATQQFARARLSFECVRKIDVTMHERRVVCRYSSHTDNKRMLWGQSPRSRFNQIAPVIIGQQTNYTAAIAQNLTRILTQS